MLELGSYFHENFVVDLLNTVQKQTNYLLLFWWGGGVVGELSPDAIFYYCVCIPVLGTGRIFFRIVIYSGII